MAVTKLGLLAVPAVGDAHFDNFDQQPLYDELNLNSTIIAIRLDGGVIGCTMDSVLMAAQGESGLAIRAITTRSVLSAHILRYRDRLMAAVLSSWKNAAQNDVTLVLPVINEREEKFAITAKLFGVWRAEARRIVGQAWEEVSIVQRFDSDAHLDPKFILRDTEIVLLNALTGWAAFDRLKLYGVTQFDNTGLDFAADVLHPNELLAPAFCRCLELKGAWYLLQIARQYSAAGALKGDLSEAESTLMLHAQANGRAEGSRR